MFPLGAPPAAPPAMPPAVSPGTPLVGFDIETDTTAGGGLDPTHAAIVAVAVSTNTDDHVLNGEEIDILVDLDRLLADMSPGYLVTWNGSGFDLPFVARRAQLLGIDLGLDLTDDPQRRTRRGDEGERPAVRGRWHRLVHLDGYLLYRADVGRSLGLSCALKALARLVGMQPVELDRTTLHLVDDQELRAYVASDARVAVELVRRRMPAATSIADHPLAGLPFESAATLESAPMVDVPGCDATARDTERSGC